MDSASESVVSGDGQIIEISCELELYVSTVVPTII